MESIKIPSTSSIDQIPCRLMLETSGTEFYDRTLCRMFFILGFRQSRQVSVPEPVEGWCTSTIADRPDTEKARSPYRETGFRVSWLCITPMSLPRLPCLHNEKHDSYRYDYYNREDGKDFFSEEFHDSLNIVSLNRECKYRLQIIRIRLIFERFRQP